MHLVVGLGNPGPKYAATRHNAGFMVLDELARRAGAGPFRDKFSGAFTKAQIGGQEVVLLKPQTFMNLSGQSLQKAAKFFKLGLKETVVVHDELDLSFGTVRVKLGGGAAGHNGLKSLMQHGGGDGFVRIRVGIDRPPSGRVEGYVLNDFNASERAELDDVLRCSADAVEAVVALGAQAAMNAFNQRSRPGG